MNIEGSESNQVVQAPTAHTPVPAAAEDAYARRLKVLGICFAVFCVYSLAMLIYFLVVTGTAGAASMHNAPPGSRAAEHTAAQNAGMLVLFGLLVNAVRVMAVVLSLIAAIGLLGRHRWGRTAAIVVSIPLLIVLPVGTVLAIYTLYLMLKAGSSESYRILSV